MYTRSNFITHLGRKEQRVPEDTLLSFTWLLNNPHAPLTTIALPQATGFRAIQTNELEDPTGFIQPESIVLTVGMAFADRPAELPRYFQRLIDAGAVAIGFGTGVSFATIPQNAIDMARRHGIGLFEVAKEVAFASIVGTVHAEQTRLSQRAQRTLLRTQEQLTKTATAGSLQQLIVETARLTQSEIHLRNQDGAVIAHAAPPELAPPSSHPKSLPEPQPLPYSTRYAMTAKGTHAHTIELRAATPITAHTRNVLRHCAGLADVLLARTTALRERRNELNTLAMSALLGLTAADDAATSTAATSATLAPIFAPIADRRGFVRPVALVGEDAKVLRRALATADEQLSALSHYLFALPFDAQTHIMLVPAKMDAGGIATLAGAALPRLRVAVGAPVAWSQLTMPHVQTLARRAAASPLGQVSDQAGPELPWVREPAVTAALLARREEILGALTAADADGNSDLARTFLIFARCGGHIARTAEALGVHRHTVRNRIEKIQNLCQLDLAEPACLAECLLVALIATE